MKQRIWRERLEYFWMYYKIPFLAGVFICIVISYFIYAKVTEKDYALNAVLLDIHSDTQEELLEKDFADYAGIDRKKKEVVISMSLLFSDASSENYTMASLAKVYSQIGTEELDVCMMKEEDFIQYADSGMFMDLRKIFTDAELERFPELYRTDKGEVFGIYGQGMKKITEIKGYQGEKGVVGILYNTKNKEISKKFLEYLLEG